MEGEDHQIPTCTKESPRKTLLLLGTGPQKAHPNDLKCHHCCSSGGFLQCLFAAVSFSQKLLKVQNSWSFGRTRAIAFQIGLSNAASLTGNLDNHPVLEHFFIIIIIIQKVILLRVVDAFQWCEDNDAYFKIRAKLIDIPILQKKTYGACRNGKLNNYMAL